MSPCLSLPSASDTLRAALPAALRAVPFQALEARWIQRQARQREIADVLEFLDLES